MENAFLVRLSVSQWTARKLDKSATRDAKERAGATDKAKVKLYKTLLAASELDTIETIGSAARAEHRKRTVPWAYDGPGAITAAGYPGYKAEMMQFEKEFNNAVERFVGVYAMERADLLTNASNSMRVSLGTLFNPSDYPTANEIKSKFSFAVSAEPMPQADDFRVVGLPQDAVVEIKQGIIENNVNALQNANATAWGRVIETVEKLRLRLQEYSSGKVTKFYDSWVDNVKELAGMIPSINVANDPDLARIGQKLVALTAYSGEDLKAEVTLRDNVVKQATLVLSQIDGAYKRAA